MGTAVAQWLRCCATNLDPSWHRGFFIDKKFFRLYCGPGVDSASNRNEYQEYFLGVKAAGQRKADNLTTILRRCHEIWEP
jgi:hypothetical protein